MAKETRAALFRKKPVRITKLSDSVCLLKIVYLIVITTGLGETKMRQLNSC